MSASAQNRRESHESAGTTVTAVRQQIGAMGSELFEVGLFKPDAGPGESIMIPRVWDAETVDQVHSLVAPSELWRP